jgi:hypothetical protein
MRVAFADVQPRLRDIVRDALADDGDTELTTCTVAELEQQTRFECDVLVATVGSGSEGDYADRLLSLVPRAKLLLISRRGDRAMWYELRPVKRELTEVSPAELARAIRSARPRS